MTITYMWFVFESKSIIRAKVFYMYRRSKWNNEYDEWAHFGYVH